MRTCWVCVVWLCELDIKCGRRNCINTIKSTKYATFFFINNIVVIIMIMMIMWTLKKN